MKTDYFDKAAQQFANLMIEKIQQVEDNWQKPWITIAANTRNFFPQNLTGRRYTGGNAFLLLFLCEKFQYQTPVFMTFNQAYTYHIYFMCLLHVLPFQSKSPA